METVDLQLSCGNLTIFQFLLEGYDGMATVTTTDPNLARVRISLITESSEESREIINQVIKEITN